MSDYRSQNKIGKSQEKIWEKPQVIVIAEFNIEQTVLTPASQGGGPPHGGGQNPPF